jgi:iron uptake system EfeUOB component EfeO/EfeM
MSNSKIALSLIAAATTLSLAACSGSTTSNPSPTAQTTPAAAEQKGGETIEQGLPKMTKLVVDLRLALNDNDAAKAKTGFTAVHDAWEKFEDAVKAKDQALYGNIETQLGVLKSGTKADKLDVATLKKAAGELDLLLFTLDPAAGAQRIKAGATDMAKEITALKDALAKNDAAKVKAQAEKVHDVWWVFEHDVKAKDKDVYAKVEEPLGAIRAGAKQSPLDSKTLTDLTGKLEALVTPLTK